jgi:DNA-binding beta-propeller fold protein YncE
LNDLYTKPKLIGIYGPDGKFRKTSRLVYSGAPGPSQEGLRPAELPPFVDLPSIERIVEDYEPPAHAAAVVKGQSLPVILLARVAALAYGRGRVLLAPTHVTTDSRQRLIISDPDLPAVHVLEVAGKNSFRIAGGPQHRMQMPNGVAVDAADNIYVADGKKGMILVYDPQGRFLRYLGNVSGESLFEAPSGIALDRKAGHLYVLDSPVHELIMLDLHGKVLKRVGNKRGPAGGGVDYPTEIALGNDEVVVLDRAGSRIQVFDLQCNFLRTFAIQVESGPPVVREIGLSLDSRSNIYISNLNGPMVRIYDRDGHLVGGLERDGLRFDAFNDPSGIWIDSADRIYVADTRNNRVQVFLGPVRQIELRP